jgi:putative lipoprotein
MQNQLLVPLTAIVLTLATSLSGVMAAETLKFSGQVTYRERIALPPNAQLRLSLVPLAQPKSPVVGATAVIDAIGQVPLQFSFDVRSNVVDDGRQYGLSAQIVSGDTVVFSNAEPVVVNIDEIAPVMILVRPIPTEPVVEPVKVELLETIWILDNLSGKPVIGRQPPTLSLSKDGRVGGNSGCNTYFAGATLKGTDLSFGVLAGTQMACSPDLMAQEQAFLSTLANTSAFALDGTRLTLVDASGTAILGFHATR